MCFRLVFLWPKVARLLPARGAVRTGKVLQLEGDTLE